MSRPRLLLADDHTLVLEGLLKLLEPEFEVAGVVEDGKALVAAAGEIRPDAILMDISMPRLNGIEATRQVRKTAPRAKVIFVTMHADPAYVTEALRAGASGYLLKRSAASELAVAIREVLKGRLYVTPLVSPDVVESFLHTPRTRKPGLLTPRQREVLQLVAEGRTNKEIAAQLTISLKTVEFHKSAIMRALGMRTIAELTQYAVAHHIV